MLEPVQRLSLSDAVFRQLRERIVHGEWKPGQPLPAERSLCEALGVNLNPIYTRLRLARQAFKRFAGTLGSDTDRGVSA